jgi:hypothetical protein
MKPLVGFVVSMLLICTSLVSGQAVNSSSIGYPALTEVSYNYFGGSARAMGMGYAFVGLSNDVSSGLWNPAGLYVLEGPIVAASYNVFRPAGDFTQNLTPVTTKNNLDLSGIGHFSFVAPVRIKGHPWVANFNYDRNNEFSNKSAYLTNERSGLNPDTFLEDKGYTRTFNVGASTRLYKTLSMGFTINIFDSRRFWDRTNKSVQEIVIDIYGNSLMAAETHELIDSTTSNGFNFNLGLMWKYGKFSFGGVVHTPFTAKHTTNSTDYSILTLNNLVQVDYTSTILVVDSLAKQEIPLSTIFGVAFAPNANLTLTGDVGYQNYGSTNWFYLTKSFFEPNGDRIDFYEQFPIDWNNTMGIGLGVEYMRDTKFGRLPLRAGFRFDQLPQPKSITVTTNNVDFDSENQPIGRLSVAEITREAKDRQNSASFSLGTGIHWSRIDLDFAYMFTSGAKLDITEVNISYAEDQDGNPLAVTESSARRWERKSNEFRFTFTGYF